MRGIYTPVTDIRRKVFTEVARMSYESNEMADYAKEIRDLPFKIMPGEDSSLRSSIFLERAIVSERIRLAMGLSLRPVTESVSATEDLEHSVIADKYYEPPLINVIKFACNKCPEKIIKVTSMCQGCLAHPCQEVCPKKAISFRNGRSHIDQDLCIKCGRCHDVCPYSAIIKNVIPCEDSCPVGAISKDESGKEHIDPEKCILCGKCLQSCPFGAVVEMSQMVDVLKLLADENKKVVAMLAPAVLGQFPGTINNLIGALKKLGFADVVEVAIGADITTRKEAAEFIEKMENGEKMMTTSCCPAYYKAADLHIPEIKPFVSHTRTPMYYTAELLKQEQPECTAVFVGPCLAKRFEAENDPNVDYVLTFEEIGAMLVASGINVADCEPQEFAKISCAQGRRFPVSGGVAGAVASLVEGKAEFKPTAINGLNKASIKLLKQYATKGSDFNMIEVMCCEGGCVAGPGCVALAKKSAIMVENYVKTAPDLKDKQD